MSQGINEQIGTLPAVKPERHFVQVGLQMLGAYLVPTPDNAPLEQRERRFNTVRVDVGSKPDVFSCRMVHSFMLEVTIADRPGGPPLVSGAVCLSAVFDYGNPPGRSSG